jgi:hypothetical protein
MGLIVTCRVSAPNHATIEHAPSMCTAANDTDYVHLGCFMDKADASALATYHGSDPRLTIPRCMEKALAAGNRFFGVEAGSRCFSSSSLTEAVRHGMSTDCSIPCAGNDKQACGGSRSVQLYMAGVTGVGEYMHDMLGRPNLGLCVQTPLSAINVDPLHMQWLERLDGWHGFRVPFWSDLGGPMTKHG